MGTKKPCSEAGPITHKKKKRKKKFHKILNLGICVLLLLLLLLPMIDIWRGLARFCFGPPAFYRWVVARIETYDQLGVARLAEIIEKKKFEKMKIFYLGRGNPG